MCKPYWKRNYAEMTKPDLIIQCQWTMKVGVKEVVNKYERTVDLIPSCVCNDSHTSIKTKVKLLSEVNDLQVIVSVLSSSCPTLLFNLPFSKSLRRGLLQITLLRNSYIAKKLIPIPITHLEVLDQEEIQCIIPLIISPHFIY